MLLSTFKNQDKVSILFLILGVPLFFPFIIFGKVPGPFAAGVTDTFVFFEPYARVFIDAIKNGENPFWSHESSFGAPTLLTLGTGALHPFHFLHLIFPGWLAFAIGWWARLSIFSVFFYAYIRLRHCRPWIAVSFTIALTYGSLFLNYSLEVIGYVMCFFPMALFYADRMCAEVKSSDFAFLALAIACTILGGFPSVVLYLLLALGAYILVMSKTWSNLFITAFACCVGILLVLPTITETLSFYPTTGYDPEQRKWLFFYDPPLHTALNLVIPSIFGNQVEYRSSGMRDFYGSLLGAGILTLPLVIICSTYLLVNKIRLKKEILFWVTLLVLCLIAYFNIFEIKQFLKFIPVLNEHPFTRLQTLIVMSLVIASALTFENVLQLNLPKRHLYYIFASVVMILICFYGYSIFNFNTKLSVVNCLKFGVIAIVSTLALMWAVLNSSPVGKLTFITCNILLGIVTSLTFTYYFLPKDYYPENVLINHVKKNLVQGAKVLDVQNKLFRNTAIAYGIPSITNHWFSPPELRKWVYSLSSQTSKKGLTIDVVNSINYKQAWSTLRKMHVQFVALPYSGNKLLIDLEETSDFRVIEKDMQGIALLEVLSNGQTLKQQGGLRGEGYFNYEEHAGRISFSPTTNELIKIPVRFNDGWHIQNGATEILAGNMQLLEVRPNNNLDLVELYYFPKNFLLLLTIGPLILLFSIVLLSNLNRKKSYLHPLLMEKRN